MALVTISEVKDVATLLTMQIKGYRAWDKRRNITLCCSHGRRMTGRPRFYYGSYPDGNWKTTIRVAAYTDEEARDKFLKKLRIAQGGSR